MKNGLILGVRLFGSLAFLLFQIGRVGIVLFLPAIVLSTATGINIYTNILVMGNTGRGPGSVVPIGLNFAGLWLIKSNLLMKGIWL